MVMGFNLSLGLLLFVKMAEATSRITEEKALHLSDTIKYNKYCSNQIQTLWNM